MRQAGALWPAEGVYSPPWGSGLPCRCLGASAQPEEGCSGVSLRVAFLQTPWLLDGWVMGVSGSNPEHVLHRPSPADMLETAAFQQLLPHASGWVVAQWKLISSE